MVPELVTHLVASLVAVTGKLLSIFDAVRSIAMQSAGTRPTPRNRPFTHARSSTYAGSLCDSRSWRRWQLTGTRPILQERPGSTPSASTRTSAWSSGGARGLLQVEEAL